MTPVLAVIPARYQASRLPGKPLARLWGKPLIQHVWERAREASGIDELVVAVEDERVARAARGFGARVEMTSPEHATGTDRVAEVARRRPGFEIVLNLQGDEPDLDPGAVGRLVAAMRADPELSMTTLAHPEPEPSRLAATEVVKVVVDAEGFALYFSRADLAGGSRGGPVLRHVGVYGFRRGFLLEFAGWPPGTLEQAERLEQLRALERGVRIQVIHSAPGSGGVDTPRQLEALERQRRGP